MPPPALPGNRNPLARPLATVTPEIVTTEFGVIWNTRLVALLLMVSFAAPGPRMVTLLSTNSSPLVSVIVPLTVMLIVPPLDARESALRNEPGPLSAVLVTALVPA